MERNRQPSGHQWPRADTIFPIFTVSGVAEIFLEAPCECWLTEEGPSRAYDLEVPSTAQAGTLLSYPAVDKDLDLDALPPSS